MTVGVARGPGVLWDKDRAVPTADGATIAYASLGPEDGPAVALCSGFLCPDTWWAQLVPLLVTQGRRVLIAHYRGIGSSSLPTEPDEHSFSVPRFAHDVVDVLDAEGVREVVLAGHSMGTQVMLEAWRILHERGDIEVLGMASLTGPFASPLRTLYDRPGLGLALYHPIRTAALLTMPRLLRLGWRLGLRHVPAFEAGRLLGVLGPRTPPDLLRGYVDHAEALDPAYAVRVLRGMHAHTAEDLLAEVDTPTLVVVGGRDPWSPPRLGEEMVARMPGAYLRVVPHGTHATVLEYPELVGGWVLDLLDDVQPVRVTAAAG